jgi:hypothetical protein
MLEWVAGTLQVNQTGLAQSQFPPLLGLCFLLLPPKHTGFLEALVESSHHTVGAPLRLSPLRVNCCVTLAKLLNFSAYQEQG